MRKLFSVDDHILEPPNVWADRMPAKYRELAPHVVTEGERELWVINGKRSTSTGLFAVAGKKPEEWNSDPINYAQMTPGCYDPAARSREFLSNGVCASVSFPTQVGFAGEAFLKTEDRHLASACVEAYNDWMLDEWCPGGIPGMLVPTIMAKLWDAEASGREILRCAAKGARALTFPENVVRFGLPSYWSNWWDPVWRACEEADIPICMHIGTGFGVTSTAAEAPSTLSIALGNVSAQLAMVDFSMSPVCRKFPGLKLAFSEGGIGWIPAALERADRQFIRHAPWTGQSGALPSEIFRQNMYFCMIYEPVGLHMTMEAVGIERIFWELDYPHADSPWPDAQAEVEEQFHGLPEATAEAILFRNAERVFNWKSADLPSATRKVA